MATDRNNAKHETFKYLFSKQNFLSRNRYVNWYTKIPLKQNLHIPLNW